MHKKISGILIMTILVLSLCVTSSLNVMAGTQTWYVDDSNTSGTEDGTQANPYNTISEAVTAASAGDTVIVAGGTYVEDVSVQKSLIIKAQNGFPANTRMGIGYFGVGGVLTATPIPEMDEVLENAIEAGMVFKSDTIAGLADEIGVNPATLVAAVNRYNELCDKGTDDDFQKPAENLIEVKTSPFYAITGCVQPFHLPGGLNIDTNFRVLHANDHETPIYGLYAICGDSANVIYSDYKTYAGGGMAQGWTVHSGRLGGINAAEYIASTS
jgi:hypothetical protein